VRGGQPDGEPGLPRFQEDDFQAFLRCGIQAHGFARLRCDGCRRDRLLPPSCTGRAAHTVDRLLP
jgi:hypothetical protein